MKIQSNLTLRTFSVAAFLVLKLNLFLKSSSFKSTCVNEAGSVFGLKNSNMLLSPGTLGCEGILLAGIRFFCSST